MIHNREFCLFIAFLFILNCDLNVIAQERAFVTNSRLILGTEMQLSASVRAGDMDGDGDVDLVVANGRHWPQQNVQFVNQSRGLFTIARPLGIDRCTSYACELADLDSDGDLDIAVGNDNAPCLVFTNDGKGRFKRHCEFGKPSSVRSLATADIDGDGDIDLLVTCRGRANQIYFNSGKAEFSESTTFGSKDDSTIDVAIADLNEDGRKDLILANRDSQPNTILLNQGDSKFTNGIPFGDPKMSSRAVAVADFNGDGHIDWVVGNIGSSNTIYFGDGKGGVTRELKIGRADGRTYCIAVADLNNDQMPDVVAGNVGQSNTTFFNSKNQGRNKFIDQEFGQAEAATYGLCVADVTGDGFVDVVVANSDLQNRIYVNRPGKKKP